MGGNVGVIVRKENGEQIGMSRWTNIMPYHFKNINLYLGKTTEWFNEFCAEWLKMKEDYEKHKDTGSFEHTMTPVYFPHNNLSPDEYGIIVVDFMDKKIYSSQDYCNIGSLSFFHVWNSRASDPQVINNNIKLINDYVNHGLIKKIRYYDCDNKEYKTIDISSLTADEIVQLLKESSDYKCKNFSHALFKDINKDYLNMYTSAFLIDCDWEFTIYHDRTLGVLKVKKELEQDGFVFTEKDNAAWKDYVSWGYSGEDASELEDDEEFKEFKKVYFEVFNEPFILKE